MHEVNVGGDRSEGNKETEPESTHLVVRRPSLLAKGELGILFQVSALGSPFSFPHAGNTLLLTHSFFTWRMKKVTALALLSNHTLLRLMTPKSPNLEVYSLSFRIAFSTDG